MATDSKHWTGAIEDDERPEAVDASKLYEDYAAFVWLTLQRLGVQRDDLEDLSQEVFLTAHRKRSRFEGRSSGRTWLFGICVNLVRNHRRRARHRYERFGLDPEGIEGECQRRGPMAAHDVVSLLNRLDPERRAIFVMFEAEQMSCREIAQALGIPLGTVHSRLHAARRDLERVVAKLRSEADHE